MASRALVIAIENYANVQDGSLLNTLPGTLEAGRQFSAWLQEKWKQEGGPASGTQLIFCSEPRVDGGRGATRADLIGAFDELKAAGVGTTEELFFFFSGHGFSFVERPDKRADMVIAGDYVSTQLSGPCCFNLDEITSWLRAHLGPGHHYFFVDACRNRLTSRDIRVPDRQLTWDPQAPGEASTFVLQSTADGAAAAVDDSFPKELLAGLKGHGKAKVWSDTITDAMLVRYDSLRSYIKSHVKNQSIYNKVVGPDGESDGVLAVLRPIPLSKCQIEVVDAVTPIHGQIVLKRGRYGADQLTPLTAARAELALEPDSYRVALRLDDPNKLPDGALVADLYEDCTLTFKAGGAQHVALQPSPCPPAPATGELTIAAPTMADVRLRNVESGAEQSMKGGQRVTLAPGRYFAQASVGATEYKRAEVEVEQGKEASVDLGEWSRSAPHVAIASLLPVSGDSVYFSESLGGAVVDPDLDLWLAIVGAGRILGSTGKYSKLARFPLHDFAGEAPGACPVYLLAGLEQPSAALRVSVTPTPAPAFLLTSQPSGMQGVRELYLPVSPGSHLLSFKVDNGRPYTVATHATPNRATLITLTFGVDGVTPNVAQYLLPIGHLIQFLDPYVAGLLQGRNHLRDVMFLAQASRVFRKRRDLSRTVSGGELTELTYGKWLDPLASSLAAYELVRRGHRAMLPTIVDNMKRYFADLPDTAALAALAAVGGDKVAHPQAPPLFLDGVRAFPDYPDWLPLPASHLDATSQWTAWRDAVHD